MMPVYAIVQQHQMIYMKTNVIFSSSQWWQGIMNPVVVAVGTTTSLPIYLSIS